MEKNELLKKLNEVFCEVFDNDKIKITSETTANDIEEWDSLTHISLLAAIEDEFDVKLNMNTVLRLKNVGELVDMLLESVK